MVKYKQIKPKKKLCFIHIPKTGGVSIRKEIEKHKLDIKVAIHKPAIKFKNYDHFTVVRNPWDRVLSAFCFMNDGGHYKKGKKVRDWSNRKFDLFLDGFIEHKMYKSMLLRPQSYYYLNENRDMVIKHIHKFECGFEQFVFDVVNLYFDSIEFRIGTENVSKRDKDYRVYYKNPKHIDMISDIYKKEICDFGYEFE